MAVTKVFLSHSSTHASQTRAVEKLICRHANGTLSMFRSEKIKAGADWFDEIFRQLDKTDMFMLLIFEPVPNVEWVNFEAGIFAGLSASSSKEKPLIVIHADGVTVPATLKGRHNVLASASNIEAVENLLLQLYGCESGRSAAKCCSDERERRIIALELIGHFPRYVEPDTHFFDRRITLLFTLQQAEALRGKGVIEDTVQVVGLHGSLVLFGFEPSKTKSDWKNACERISANTQDALTKEAIAAWPRQLARILRVAIDAKLEEGGLRPADGLPLFFSRIERITYRPSLYARTFTHGSGVEFNLNFTRLPAELWARPTGKLGIVSHLIELCRLLWFGILVNERFQILYDPGSARSLSARESQELLEQFYLAFNNVRSDFLNRGIDLASAYEAFNSPLPLLNHESTVREILLEESPALRAELKRAVQDNDPVGAGKVLARYRERTLELYRICAVHYNHHIKGIQQPLSQAAARRSPKRSHSKRNSEKNR